MANFDDEHQILETIIASEQGVFSKLYTPYPSNLHWFELVNIEIYVLNMKSSKYFINIYRFGFIIGGISGPENQMFGI